MVVVLVVIAVILIALNTVFLCLSLKNNPHSSLSLSLQNIRDTQTQLTKSLQEELARNRSEVATVARDNRQEILSSFEMLSNGVSSRITEFRTELTGAIDSLSRRLDGRLGEAMGAQVTQSQTNSSSISLALANSARTVSESIEQLRSAVEQQFAAIQRDTSEKLELIRGTTETKLACVTGTLAQTMEGLSKTTSDGAEKLRSTVETRLTSIENNNGARLEQMRLTVDEKLQATLEQRLGESFRLVSERLEEVHKGLGEMRTLASGVGDLKKVLMNIKARGNWGEVQIGALLEQMLTPDQYSANVQTDPDSNERVEYAIKLPGRDASHETVWLPIDSKFPNQDYERLIEASERGDAPAIAQYGAALEETICAEAKKIREKYVRPPYTVDFAVLFLPTEGLFAEILRRPGMYDRTLAERIVIAGPTTLAALLSSLQMGFRTLAIEKRSGEVWRVLGAVKSEFGKFGEALGAVEKKLNEASNKLGDVRTRSRVLTKRLREVQEAPTSESGKVLQVDSFVITADENSDRLIFSSDDGDDAER